MRGGIKITDAAAVQAYILDRVTKAGDGCWLWNLAVNSCGYGRAHYEGLDHLAHRLSFAAFKEHPRDLCVRHTCDVPRCCNPAHMVLGTQAENMDDMKKRGRAFRWGGARKGANNPRARLTETAVVAIRKSADTTASLAKSYGVSASTIADVRAGRRWGHVQ